MRFGSMMGERRSSCLRWSAGMATGCGCGRGCRRSRIPWLVGGGVVYSGRYGDGDGGGYGYPCGGGRSGGLLLIRLFHQTKTEQLMS